MNKMWVLLLPAAILSLGLSGCGPKTENVGAENVEAVVENLFEDLEESDYEELTGKEGEATPASTELPDWVQDRFQGYMTEGGYETLTGTAFYEISVKAFENHKSMDLENLEVQEKEGDYEIKGDLTIAAEGEETSIEIQGSAQTDQTGLVSYLDLSNISEIAEALQS